MANVRESYDKIKFTLAKCLSMMLSLASKKRKQIYETAQSDSSSCHRSFIIHIGRMRNRKLAFFGYTKSRKRG
jgi:hypothetical protein